MKINIPMEWSLRMARLEGGAEIGAGLLARDPVPDDEVGSTGRASLEEPNIAFGRFVSLMRRRRGLTLEKLAEDADVEILDLVEIESDTRHRPEPRTVYQLANFFDVPRDGLLQIAGLTVPKNRRVVEEAVRFAARSEPVSELTDEERGALEAFVAVLSEQK
jgi:transcriptional regulator with XRE-family HTH domain